MRTLSLVVMTAVIALSGPVAAQTRDGLRLTHAETLQRLEIIPAAGGGGGLEAMRMRFEALGRAFDLDLEPNTALFSGAARARFGTGIDVLRGELTDAPGSWARVVIADGVPSGLIYDGQELLAIEAPGDAIGRAQRPQLFRLADLEVSDGAMSCGVEPETANGQSFYNAMVSDIRTALQTAPGAVEEIDIGVVADAAFASGRADPRLDLVRRMNNVDGIYSNELGIQMTVDLIEILSEGDTSLSDTTDSNVLVSELADYRLANSAQNVLGLTHLFTGRNLIGTSVGIAYINVLCSQQYAVALTEASGGLTNDSLVAAHEIGHNFGADHDGDPNGSCPNEPGNLFLMAPSVNGSQTFSECSKSIMLANASKASCIVPLPSIDVTVTSFDQPDRALLGNTISLEFEVRNRGSIEAGSVTVAIEIPTLVTVTAAAATQGSCVQGASILSCDIGNLAGASGVTITLTATADDTGTARFSATATAVSDDNPANNSDVQAITIEPAVELGVTVPASSVTLNQSTSVSIGIGNDASIAATDVTAVVTVDQGLQANSANWSAGSCTVDGPRIDCATDLLQALSDSTLTLNLTGTTAGTQGYTVTLSSSETDRDTTNNVVSGTVNVVQATANASTASDDGGGGGTGLLWLVTLTFAVSRRRAFTR